MTHGTIISTSCNWMGIKGLKNIEAKIKPFKFDIEIEV